MSAAQHDTTVETYCLEGSNVGPLLEVEAARGGGAKVSMEVGYWGIGLVLDPRETVRLRDQLTRILDAAESTR